MNINPPHLNDIKYNSIRSVKRGFETTFTHENSDYSLFINKIIIYVLKIKTLGNNINCGDRNFQSQYNNNVMLMFGYWIKASEISYVLQTILKLGSLNVYVVPSTF